MAHTMTPWTLACLLACCVGAWAPAVHAQGAFGDCCLNYDAHTKWLFLRHAKSYQMQDVSGSCNLPAVIFHFPRARKMVCGDPQNPAVRKAVKFLELQALQKSARPRATFPGSPARRNRLLRPLLSKLKDPSSSKRTAP